MTDTPGILITVVTRDGYRYVYTARTTPALEADQARAIGFLEISHLDRVEGHGPDGEHGTVETPMRYAIPWGNIGAIFSPTGPPVFTASPPGQEAEHHRQPSRAKGGRRRK